MNTSCPSFSIESDSTRSVSSSAVITVTLTRAPQITAVMSANVGKTINGLLRNLADHLCYILRS